MVIISSYPASSRRISVLVNFQAILLIFSGKTSSIRDIFFTEDAAKKYFPTSKISHSVFPYLVKLNDIGSYHGLREPIRKLENQYPELKICEIPIYVIFNIYIIELYIPNGVQNSELEQKSEISLES